MCSNVRDVEAGELRARVRQLLTICTSGLAYRGYVDQVLRPCAHAARRLTRQHSASGEDAVGAAIIEAARGDEARWAESDVQRVNDDMASGLRSRADVGDTAATQSDGGRRERANATKLRPAFVPEEAVEKCDGCSKRFGMLRWRKRCAACAGVFCYDCSSHSVTMRFGDDLKAVRVCDECFKRAVRQRRSSQSVKAKGSQSAHL